MLTLYQWISWCTFWTLQVSVSIFWCTWIQLHAIISVDNLIIKSLIISSISFHVYDWYLIHSSFYIVYFEGSLLPEWCQWQQLLQFKKLHHILNLHELSYVWMYNLFIKAGSGIFKVAVYMTGTRLKLHQNSVFCLSVFLMCVFGIIFSSWNY